jgi:hypothetical protein
MSKAKLIRQVYLCIHIYTCINMYTHVCKYVFVCIHRYRYICLNIYTYMNIYNIKLEKDVRSKTDKTGMCMYVCDFYVHIYA